MATSNNGGEERAMVQTKSRPGAGPLFEEVQMQRNVKTSIFVVAMAAGFLGMAPAVRADGPFQYYPVSPCRVADTRINSGGVMGTGQDRTFGIQGACGIP